MAGFLVTLRLHLRPPAVPGNRPEHPISFSLSQRQGYVLKQPKPPTEPFVPTGADAPLQVKSGLRFLLQAPKQRQEVLRAPSVGRSTEEGHQPRPHPQSEAQGFRPSPAIQMGRLPHSRA